MQKLYLQTDGDSEEDEKQALRSSQQPAGTVPKLRLNELKPT